MTHRPALIPNGAWPRRMGAQLAAGYCGEPTAEAFIARVGASTLNLGSVKGGGAYGSETTWTKRSCRTNSGPSATPPRIVIMEKPLPRFVIPKRLKSGQTGFYFNITRYYRDRGCTIP